MNDEIAFVKLIASRLEAAGVNYMITGSVAMMFYAVPRMTRDIERDRSADESNRKCVTPHPRSTSVTAT